MVSWFEDRHIQTNEAGTLSYTIYKFNSKWIKDLYRRPKTLKFLEESIGGKFHDITFGNNFLDMTSETKAKYIKFPSGSHTEDLFTQFLLLNTPCPTSNKNYKVS